MIALALALAWQPKPATVGDTVWVSVQVVVPAGMILRPQTWDLGELGQTLGPPEVSYEADAATVRYPVSFWFPGNHQITVPGPIVVSPAGRSDTLAGKALLVRVASVLPEGKSKRDLAPRDPAGVIGQSDRSPLPVVVALGVASLVIGGVGALLRRRWSRRRGLAPVIPAPADPLIEVLLEEWVKLGEPRTSLDGWAHLIERDLDRAPLPARSTSAAPLLAEMAAVGFDHSDRPEAVGLLIGRARDWLRGA